MRYAACSRHRRASPGTNNSLLSNDGSSAHGAVSPKSLTYTLRSEVAAAMRSGPTVTVCSVHADGLEGAQERTRTVIKNHSSGGPTSKA